VDQQYPPIVQDVNLLSFRATGPDPSLVNGRKAPQAEVRPSAIVCCYIFDEWRTALSIGKRHESRLRAGLRARLISKYGEERVVLVNLSQHGCCVEIQDPPATGDVVLRWDQFEAHGEIAWRASKRIGIRFFRAIPYEWLIATRQLSGAFIAPSTVDQLHDSDKDCAAAKRYV
jgi:hypothetical protein